MFFSGDLFSRFIAFRVGRPLGSAVHRPRRRLEAESDDVYGKIVPFVHGKAEVSFGMVSQSVKINEGTQHKLDIWDVYGKT